MGVLYRWTRGVDPVFEVSDDALVLRALAEVGISPAVLDDPEQCGLAKQGARGDQKPQPWLGVCGWADHPTHWLVFFQYSGYANAADNGWLLQGFRKTRYTEQQAVQHVKAALARAGVLDVSLRWLNADGTPSKPH